MDGNGRWAKGKGWARLQGHEAGVEAVRDVTTAAASWGIEHLTLYAFSVENWQRPKREIVGLMRFLKRFLRTELETLLENGIRLKGLGDLQALPADVLKVLHETEAATVHGDQMTLRLALSYGGRQEITHAAKELARQVAQGSKKLEEVTVESLTASLYDADMPDVDLVIRTAGELRLSNFLLWQASYAEFSFTPVLWPDFRRGDLWKALEDFDHRIRKFGLVVEADSAAEKSI
jgi:undecaprenyl diphosphate synthase